jgi:hypothetical protein
MNAVGAMLRRTFRKQLLTAVLVAGMTASAVIDGS